MSQDLYTILGVTSTATDTEIKKSYRKLAIVYHPDKNKDGAERFKEISAAYTILSDPEKRRIHDLKYTSTYASSSYRQSAYSTSSTTSAYGSKFAKSTGYDWHNNAPPRSRPVPKPAPPPRQPTPPPPPKRSDYSINISIKITLEDSYLGTSKYPLTYQETINCDTCNGQLNQTKRVRECTHCFGTGILKRQLQSKTRCAYCQGSGQETYFLNCQTCDGKKTMERPIKIKIPHGIHDSQPLRVDNKGNLMPDKKTRGDVNIKILVPNHSQDGLYTRQGDNLHIKLPISLKDAVMGFHNKKFGKQLNGEPLILSQPYGEVIKPESKRVLKNSGMPIFQSQPIKYGELHIKFDVIFPDTVNILESPSDKTVIDMLFETPEEKKARENIIVIEDDEEMDEAEEEVQEMDELDTESQYDAASEEERNESAEEEEDDDDDDDVIELSTPPSASTANFNTTSPKRPSTSSIESHTSTNGNLRNGTSSDAQPSKLNSSSSFTDKTGKESFASKFKKYDLPFKRREFPSFLNMAGYKSASNKEPNTFSTYKTSSNGDLNTSTIHKSMSNTIPTPFKEKSVPTNSKRSLEDDFKEFMDEVTSPKRHKHSTDYYELDSSDNDENNTRVDRDQHQNKKSSSSSNNRTENSSIPDLFADLLGFMRS